jgi:hypothetical protein
VEKKKISHDILNLIERLRTMHDMAENQKFEMISKEEMKQDLNEALDILKKRFLELIQ